MRKKYGMKNPGSKTWLQKFMVIKSMAVHHSIYTVNVILLIFIKYLNLKYNNVFS